MNKMFEVKIKIELKKGVSDPEGANTLKSLNLLGFDNVKDARIIRTIILLIDENNKSKIEKDVEKMCQRLLINPVIHIYKIEIEKRNT